MPADTSALAIPAIDITGQTAKQEQENPIVEATAEATKATPAADPQKARMEALARNEKRIRQQALQLQKDKEAFLKQREDVLAASIAPKAEPVAPINWEERISTDPIGTIKQAMLKIEALEAENKTLLSKQDESLKQVTETQSRAYQQALKQVGRDVNILVHNNEAFEAIQATKSQSAVVELIEQTYKEDGILLTAEEAAKQVEDFLIDSTLPLTKLKKIQAKLAPEAASQPPKRQATKEQIHVERVQPTTAPSRTLTNAIVASSKPSGEKDRVKRAIAAFQGNLK